MRIITPRLIRNKHILIFTILLLTFIFISTICSGCAYKTYTGKIGDANFSFKYYKAHHVNPYSPYWTGRFEYPNPPTISDHDPLSVSHIMVQTYKINSTREDVEMSLEHSISSISKLDFLKNFQAGERGTVAIAGQTAKYIDYYYSGLTTEPVTYLGRITSFAYKGYIVEIDILFPILAIAEIGTYDVFDLIAETFRIWE